MLFISKLSLSLRVSRFRKQQKYYILTLYSRRVQRARNNSERRFFKFKEKFNRVER